MGIFRINKATPVPEGSIVTNTSDKDAKVPEAFNTKDKVVDFDNIEPLPKTETKEKEDVAIVLDGPLSHIYTQALNKVFAKEEYEINYQSTFTNATDYVFCSDGNMDEDQFHTALSDIKIASESHSTISIVLESKPNRKAELIQDMVKSINGKVYFSKEEAINDIVSRLRK
jgi:hypothetical protein